MPFDEPSWWYDARPTWQAGALGPIAALYGVLAARKIASRQSYRSRLPVICIGNFTAGGTGKTPLAIKVAGILKQLGRQPAFLTRGYGGRVRGAHLVAPGDGAGLVGDEPMLLARAAPTMVCSDRAAGAKALEAAGPGLADVIIMDDGLQNMSLAKDLSLVVIDGQRGLGNGRVIPAGPLRAPLAVQISLADALIVTQAGGAHDPAASSGSTVLAGLKTSFHGPVLAAEVRPVPLFDWLQERTFLAYCGIGAPRRFLDLLASLGARIVSERVFPDHHTFSDADAEGLLAQAEQLGADLVTTEKDFVRLEGFSDARAALKARSRTLAIETAFGPRDDERLLSLIRSALAAHPEAGRQPL